MKRFLLVALSLMLMFALAACGGSGDAEEADLDGNVEIEGEVLDEYRAIGIIRDLLNVDKNSLYMSFTTEFDNDLIDVELYIKGDMTRMDTSDPEFGSMSVITTESEEYIIMHDSKSYYKSMYMEDEDEMDFFYSDEDMDDYVITTGQEEVNGTLYDFEKVVDEEDVTIFYFVSGTDEWAALKSEETMMYINEISNKVDKSVFEIPSGYQEIVM